MAEKKDTREVSELVYIQSNLKAPKNQFNSFGNYKYRSCEDILEAVKPLLKEVNCTLTLTDEIVQIGDRIYVKATATFKNDVGDVYKNSAFAREPNEKKGMDASQITGMASSYARKYALNGMFCIDDTKDADTMDNTDGAPQAPAAPARGRGKAAVPKVDPIPAAPAPQPTPAPTAQPIAQPASQTSNEPIPLPNALFMIGGETTVDGLLAIWNGCPHLQSIKDFRDALAAKRKQIEGQAQ